MVSSGTAREVNNDDGSLGSEAITALAGMASDPTGVSTFERYLWQAKLAVRAWLGSVGDNKILAVVCEHVEDLSVVEATGFRFAQLKTRDKGSWSAAKICVSGHAIERLVASYKEAETAGIVGLSRFEVWLEGPPAEDKVTTAFFNDPSTAPAPTRAKIRAFGLSGAKLNDFLSKLSIHCHQPARPSIDAVIIRLIGAVWPAMTMEQIEALYETLLQAAEAAQAATKPPPSVRAAMLAAYTNPSASGAWDPIASQTLSEAQLRSLCPPLPIDTDQDLLTRAAAGESTLLELKLTRAGASGQTVQSALLARADADVVATTGRAAGTMTTEAEQALDLRLLSAAGSVAALAVSSAATVQRPGEQIYHTLMSSVANTAALDTEGLYARDHRLVVGHLCSVSDQCRFGWGVS